MRSGNSSEVRTEAICDKKTDQHMKEQVAWLREVLSLRNDHNPTAKSDGCRGLYTMIRPRSDEPHHIVIL